MGRYSPPASPAEAAEREAARAAKLEQLHVTLAEQVGAIRNGQDWQRWLHVAATFPTYSLNNVLLIAAQRPDATAVAGFGAWKALGRQVDKGSKGIAILAPMVRRPKAGQPDHGPVDAAAASEGAEAGAGTSASSAGGADGDATRDPARSGRSIGGFKVVHVFDVAQTSGQPLPERPRPVLLAGQAPHGLWDALAEQVRARGFELRRGDCPGGVNGLTHYLERTVTVRADVDDAQAVKTLAHELAHVLLHDPTGRATVTTPGVTTTATATEPGAALAAADPALPPETAATSAGQCRGRWEVEAESVAYLVSSVHGLDTGAYTFAYVAGWAGEVAGADVDQVVRGTAQRVLVAAKVVLAGTEHLLDEPAQARQARQQCSALAADAARGAERTAALLTDAVATANRTASPAAATPAAATPAAVTPGSAAPAAAAMAAGPTVERLLEVHALAVGFYSGRLHAGGPDARRAVALLTERGVDRDAAGAARLGYAPRTWTGLVDHLRGAGVDDVELRDSGLVLESSRGTLVDRFRDRVIFPVDTLDGQTVALLGRAVDEDATDRNGDPVPKYLNSPSTALYSKSEHLYGLGAHASQALAAGAQPVLVEGPMDVLAVNRAASSPGSGAPAHVAVAPCGTALTQQQVQLLDTVTGGLAERGIVTALDGDDAGRQASLRAYDLLRQVQAWPSALDLPAGQDPAGLAGEHGAAALHAALLAAAGKPLADLVVDERIARHPLQWTEGQVAAGRDAAAAVATMPTEHVGRQVARVSALTGLDTATVSGMVVDAVTAPSRTPRRGGADPTAAAQPPKAAATAPLPRVDAGHPLPASGRAVASTQSAAQRARAGFPIPLHAGLRPPAPAALGTSPPAAPEQHHRSRTA
jgi:DNA primase